MFTGIVQQLGRVAAVETNDFGMVLRIDPRGWSHRPAIGDSIAVNGCCLTVAEDSDQSGRQNQPPDLLRFDVIRQTLAATATGELRPGDGVNLEHAVTPQTMLGGHVVQGHVDAVGVVVPRGVVREATQWRVRVQPPREAMDCIVERGSIAMSGVSLTVAAVGVEGGEGIGGHWFEVALIPTTLKLTNLASLREGSRVNLETDYVAKIVVNWLRRSRL